MKTKKAIFDEAERQLKEGDFDIWIMNALLSEFESELRGKLFEYFYHNQNAHFCYFLGRLNVDSFFDWCEKNPTFRFSYPKSFTSSSPLHAKNCKDWEEQLVKKAEEISGCYGEFYPNWDMILEEKISNDKTK